MYWQTSRRRISLDRPLVMGILNVSPDSFSDGGKFVSIDRAVAHANDMIDQGVDVIDIGGESTRPGSVSVSAEEEIRRTAPVIAELVKRFDVPLSIDTSKSEVAFAAVQAGAEIINDISGLRFDERIGDVAAAHKTGLALMYSRGDFATMHSVPPVDNVLAGVTADFTRAIQAADKHRIPHESIALDIGVGFGKSLEQNLELIAKLDKIVKRFPHFPVMIGTSRKSFIGKILDGARPEERLSGSIASIAVAVWHGAKIVRVHDVRQTVEALRVVGSIRNQL